MLPGMLTFLLFIGLASLLSNFISLIFIVSSSFASLPGAGFDLTNP